MHSECEVSIGSFEQCRESWKVVMHTCNILKGCFALYMLHVIFISFLVPDKNQFEYRIFTTGLLIFYLNEATFRWAISRSHDPQFTPSKRLFYIAKTIIKSLISAKHSKHDNWEYLHCFFNKHLITPRSSVIKSNLSRMIE